MVVVSLIIVIFFILIKFNKIKKIKVFIVVYIGLMVGMRKCRYVFVDMVIVGGVKINLSK